MVKFDAADGSPGIEVCNSAAWIGLVELAGLIYEHLLVVEPHGVIAGRVLTGEAKVCDILRDALVIEQVIQRIVEEW